MKKIDIKRAWVNQPSTLQKEHSLHGELVLFADTDDPFGVVDVWFTSGTTTSRRMFKSSLSYGWPEQLQIKAQLKDLLDDLINSLANYRLSKSVNDRIGREIISEQIKEVKDFREKFKIEEY